MEYIKVYRNDKELFTCEIDKLRVNSNLMKSKFQGLSNVIDKITVLTNTINKLDDFITLSENSEFYHIINKKELYFNVYK